MADDVETTVWKLDVSNYRNGLNGLSSELAKTKNSIIDAINPAEWLKKAIQGVTGAVHESWQEMVEYGKAQAIFYGDIEKLRKASGGLLTDLELMRDANADMLLDLKLTSEQEEKLTADTGKLGRALGLNLIEAMDKVEGALLRQDTRMVRAYGITFKAKDAYEEYARSINKATDALTDEEKQLAFNIKLQKEIAEKATVVGDKHETLTDIFKRGGVALKNLTTYLLAFANTNIDIPKILDPLGTLEKRAAAARREVAALNRELINTIEARGMSSGLLGFTYGDAAEGLDSTAIGGRGGVTKGAYGQMSWKDSTGDLIDGSVGEKRSAYSEYKGKAARAGRAGGKAERGDLIGWITEKWEGAEAAAQSYIATAKSAIGEGVKGAFGLDEKSLSGDDASSRDAFAKKYQADLTKQQKTEEARLAAIARASERLKSSIKSHGGMDFFEAILPDESYDKFVDRLATMGDMMRSFTLDMVEGLEGATDALGEAIFNVISGEKEAGESFKDSFNKWLKVQGQKWMMTSIEQGFAALISLAMEDYKGASMHAAAAAGYGVLAGLAGAGAAATNSEATSASSSAKAGYDRGLGGSSSRGARATGSVNISYNISSLIGPNADEVARFTAIGTQRARQNGWI